ncbi:hypothetical protein B6U99_01020 [Candidatus Geothermarchaeota archaeon ex4572_27]|nr:MAG: hypothetical protein B6U99_01020 [Candidatus Geothermarchaeota archaeon ex4572_27]
MGFYEVAEAFAAIFALVILAPELARGLGLPVIVVELAMGLLIGRSLLDIVPRHPIIDFFASFGLIYLMFLVGLEVSVEGVRGRLGRTAAIAASSVLLPFAAGVGISRELGVEPLLLGTVFSTTSLGIVLPLTRELDYGREYLDVLLVSVAIVDIISIFLLAFSLSLIQGPVEASLIYSTVAIIVLFLVPSSLRRSGGLRDAISRWVCGESRFEVGVRVSFALIAALAAFSGWLGFHAVVGAFIAGLIVSEVAPRPSELRAKLESFGYGFFVPLFFILMGAKVDIPLLLSNITNVHHLVLVVSTAISSKFAGVFAASKLSGLTLRESASLGLFHSARVSLVIAAAEVGSEAGLIDEKVFSILVILALLSAVLGPSAGKYVLSGEVGRFRIIAKLRGREAGRQTTPPGARFFRPCGRSS